MKKHILLNVKQNVHIIQHCDLKEVWLIISKFVVNSIEYIINLNHVENCKIVVNRAVELITIFYCELNKPSTQLN